MFKRQAEVSGQEYAPLLNRALAVVMEMDAVGRRFDGWIADSWVVVEGAASPHLSREAPLLLARLTALAEDINAVRPVKPLASIHVAVGKTLRHRAELLSAVIAHDGSATLTAARRAAESERALADALVDLRRAEVSMFDQLMGDRLRLYLQEVAVDVR